MMLIHGDGMTLLGEIIRWSFGSRSQSAIPVVFSETPPVFSAAKCDRMWYLYWIKSQLVKWLNRNFSAFGMNSILTRAGYIHSPSRWLYIKWIPKMKVRYIYIYNIYIYIYSTNTGRNPHYGRFYTPPKKKTYFHLWVKIPLCFDRCSWFEPLASRCCSRSLLRRSLLRRSRSPTWGARSSGAAIMGDPTGPQCICNWQGGKPWFLEGLY